MENPPLKSCAAAADVLSLCSSVSCDVIPNSSLSFLTAFSRRLIKTWYLTDSYWQDPQTFNSAFPQTHLPENTGALLLCLHVSHRSPTSFFPLFTSKNTQDSMETSERSPKVGVWSNLGTTKCNYSSPSPPTGDSSSKQTVVRFPSSSCS